MAPVPADQSPTTVLGSEITLAQNRHLGFLSSAAAPPIYLRFYHNSDVKSLKSVYTLIRDPNNRNSVIPLRRATGTLLAHGETINTCRINEHAHGPLIAFLKEF